MELQRFLHDPDCRVLLLVMSTSGGAAGLTLTAATTAFIMEPPLNPGLEAQVRFRLGGKVGLWWQVMHVGQILHRHKV